MYFMVINQIQFLAAHCFSHKDMKLNRVSINSVYKIAVGKYNRDLTVIDNDFTQIMDVSC